jgi:hypothetical protein
MLVEPFLSISLRRGASGDLPNADHNKLCRVFNSYTNLNVYKTIQDIGSAVV